MRICAISDMHGNFDFDVKPCDITMICGDIVPLNIQWNITKSLEWLETFFIPWCTNLPCEKVLFVGGNHDKVLEKNAFEVRQMLKGQDKVIYLECETYEYRGRTIYGTPICKPFGAWSFMEGYEQQKERYERHLEIIKEIDVIMAHDAPYGVSDVLLQTNCPWADGTHIGNKALAEFVEQAKPSIMIHGHLHSTNHECEMLGDCKVYNVSLLDENYEMAYKPTYIELIDGEI